MPTQGEILNFSNQWYPEVFKNAVAFAIDENHTVRIFSAPYFLASKLDAFNDRGNNDGRTSSDFEDIISVLEKRRSIWKDINSSPTDVHDFIKNEFKKLLENIILLEWIDSNIDFTSPPSTTYIISEMKKIVNS